MTGFPPGTTPLLPAALFDLTGPTADVGTDYAHGMRGFVDWINRQGGVEGGPVELIYQDYAYRVDRAEQLYSQFVAEGVVAFMGWGTGDTEALRLRIAEDEIPFSSASLSHVLGDPAEAPYNFLVATSYSDQFRIAQDWIAENHGERTPERRQPGARCHLHLPELVRQPAAGAAGGRGGRGCDGDDTLRAAQRGRAGYARHPRVPRRRRGNRSKGRPTPTRRRGGPSGFSPRRCGRYLRRATSLRAPTSRPRWRPSPTSTCRASPCR